MNDVAQSPCRAQVATNKAVLYSHDPVVRELLSRYIARDGTEVVALGALGEAISTAAPGDVLVVVLAKATGAEPVRVARQSRPRGPILALSEDAQAAIAAYGFGADIVALLPIDLDLLCCKIAILAQREAKLLGAGNLS